MRRTSTLAIVLLGSLSLAAFPAVPSAHAQSTDRLDALPTQPIQRSTALLSDFSASDTLTEAQMLQRLARLYKYQSDLLLAQSNRDNQKTEALLDLAMTEMATLHQQPDILSYPRFLEVYRTLTNEYERYYGTSDSTSYMAYGEIFQFRADIFSALNDVEEPLLRNSTDFADLQPVETTVPMTMNNLVNNSINYLLRNPENHLLNWLSRADTYFPMIEKIFAEEGVPDELKYLAMIESGLNPRARSWARAVGMWQFIAETGRAYDLQVTNWVDERMDPEKATRAAARHLRDLYFQYGNDWHLAIAGYNCSPRCINGAISRSRANGVAKPTFWDIYPYLPRETRNYVPMFIAAALVASNPTSFNVPRAVPGAQYAYQYVPVKGRHDLDDLARMAGTDATTLRALNPALRQSSLPPSRNPYHLRIPLGSYDTFMSNYAQLPEGSIPTVGEHTVAAGETLKKIARQYGISEQELKALNNLSGSRLRTGMKLAVPVADYENTPHGVTLADASTLTVDYGSRARRPIISTVAPTLANRTTRPKNQPAAREESGTGQEGAAEGSTPVVNASTGSTAEAAEETTPETRVVYRVRRGDTLAEIAAKYHVSMADIRTWNRMRSSQVNIGQRLTIYTSGQGRTVAQASERRAPERPTTHKVRSGDNLTEIAQRYGVTVANLRAWNNLRSNTIHTGQTLKVSGNASSRAATTSRTQTYRVRSGDSLTAIARKYGVTVTQIKQWNNLRSSTIRPGQQLKIKA